MEGSLNKWTNYLSGWKPRYFVLKHGVLSYYLSSEEVGAGCRGSVRVVHCGTVSHPFDHCRLDIILPSKQYLYLRASTASERQQWLIALANSKIEGEGEGRDLAAGVSARKEGHAKLLKERRSELHLTRQLLLRQISALKKEIDSVTQGKGGDVQKMKSLGLLASATCDNFINSLDDCVTISDRFSAEITELGSLTPLPSPSCSTSLSHIPYPVSGLSQPRSPSSVSPPEVLGRVRPAYLHPLLSLTSSLLDTRTPTAASSESSLVSQKDGIIREIPPSTSRTEIPPPTPQTIPSPPLQCETILSPISELVVTILFPLDPGQILIEPFISTSRLFSEIILSTFGSIFTPIKTDMLQNVGKIVSKHMQYGREHSTLQELLLAEVEKGEHTVDASARTGVLWLNRTLHFIQVFFSGLAEDDLETSTALTRAYSISLMPHHNFIMRGIFSLLMQHAPTRADVVMTLCKGDADKEAATVLQMKLITGELSRITHLLLEFYATHGLE